MPGLVNDNELVAANSGIWTAAVLSQIALAPVAGVLYAALGAGPAFAINAGSFLLSAAVLAGLLYRPPRPRPSAEVSSPPLRGDVVPDDDQRDREHRPEQVRHNHHRNPREPVHQLALSV